MNQLINQSNQLILRELCKGQNFPDASARALRVINGWTWVSGMSRCAEFDDNIHHSVLGWEHVHAVLRDYCQSRSSLQRVAPVGARR